MTKKAKRKGLPKGAHRVRIEVKPDKNADPIERWKVTVDRLPAGAYRTKPIALDVARLRTKQIVRDGGFVSIRVHRKDGAFQREMTRPRSSDPFPPKG